MDLSLTPEEQAFAAEIRGWLDVNLELPPPFASLAEEIEWGREWQAKLARDRWVGVHWPEEFGGRGASPGPGRDLQHGVRAARVRSSR